MMRTIGLLLLATSLAAPLTFAQSFRSQGQVVFANKIGTTIDAPIYLPDGRGAGYQPGMVAQLFLVTADGLFALEPSTTFRTGPVPIAFAYVWNQTMTIDQLTEGDTGTFRLRAWESTKGATFEAARDNGGYYGETEVTVVVGGGTTPPTNLEGLQGFILARRDTLVFDPSSGDQLAIHLESTSPRTYLLESSTDLVHWTSFGALQVSGSDQVTLPRSEGRRFFRAVLQ